MQSPCRPEDDGFFGATAGVPVIVTYQFRLEAEPLASVVKLLDTVADKLIDGVLSSEFPAMCGFRRRRLDGHSASGFRFFSFQEVGTWRMIYFLTRFMRFQNTTDMLGVHSFNVLFRKMRYQGKLYELLWNI